MTLEELKEYFENSEKSVFEFGLSEPFSWRGSYDEVAFSIVEGHHTKEDILKNIQMAYSNTFFGYKGGEYKYEGYTLVNFEEGYSDYSGGSYIINKLFKYIF